MPRPVFRFAPSPNGPLHLGHALSALLNFEAAQACGGRFLVRMEDIDTVRCRPEYEAAILDDLSWLGLEWEQPVRRQSEHFDTYRAALERLADMGLVYAAFDSRTEIRVRVAEREAAGRAWPRDPEGSPLYPGSPADTTPAERAARIARGDPHALRLDMARAVARVGPLAWDEQGEGPSGERGRLPADPAAWGDVVLARKDAPSSYHLSVVVDDAVQGVTHVVRGQDLFQATSVHRLLQTLLGLPEPVYRHHRLIRDAAGRKLSKSTGATSLATLRRTGASPSDVRGLLGLL